MTMSLEDRAARIADLAVEISRRRAKSEHPDDWTRRESYTDFVTTVGSMESRVDTVDGKPVVVVWPRMHPHDGYWTHVSSEALDAAAGKADVEAGDELSFTTSRIEQGERSYEARLVWGGQQ